MARIASNKRRATSEVNSPRHRREVVAALVVAVPGVQMAAEYAVTYLIQEPMYAILTGAAWVQELPNGHATYEALGMAKPVFSQLCQELEVHCGLRNSKLLGLEEKVAIFLRICRTGDSHREIRELFQHAPGTILTYVHAYPLDNNTEHGIGFFSRHSI